MNLRKSRFSSKSKRNSSCKDIKSSLQKERTSKNTKCPPKNSSKTPSKYQKSGLGDALVISSSPALNLVTSTPISHEVRKRISRSSNEKTELKSFNKISCPIMSSPIKKAPVQTKACKIKLIPAIPMGGEYSSKTNVNQILKNIKKSSNDQSSLSLNLSIEIAQSRRSSIILRSHNASKKMPKNAKMTLSDTARPARKVSTNQKHLSNSYKSVEKPRVPKKDLHSGTEKCLKELSICLEKLPPISSVSKNTSSVPDKFNKILRSKRNPGEVSQASQGSLLQSYLETDSSKASRSNFKKTSVSQKKSYSKKKVKNKKKFSTSTKNLVSPSTSENLISDFNRISRGNNKSHNVELSQYSQDSCLSESNNEIENSKSSRYSLRLQNQKLSERARGYSLSFKTSMKSQKVTNTSKSLLESSSDNAKQPRYSLRLEEVQSSKESTVNKLSQHSSKKTSIKAQKLVKNRYRDETPKALKKIPNSKKQSSKKSTEKFQRDYMSLSENIPIDDLVLTFKSPKKRKVKSDGFKVPGKNTLKRKRFAIDAIRKADEDYEDDLYESKKFDQFKELLMDTSDSERSFSISTPKFPVTPLIRHKTPKYKDCFTPGGYEMSRQAAMEYMNRKKRRKNTKQVPETPVITEKKKLEFSQVIENAQKLQKTIESLAEEESDNDSYFSFN